MKDFSKAINYCYDKLYNNSAPKAKWLELVNNAKTNDRGEKQIPFMDYEIEKEKMDKIIQDTIKLFKINDLYKQMFKNTIYLGCSPKTKTK